MANPEANNIFRHRLIPQMRNSESTEGMKREAILLHPHLDDVVAVPGNPLDDITALQKVSFVLKNGAIYSK